jgi:TonB family protein
MLQALTLRIFRNGQLVDTKTVTQDVIKIGRLRTSHLCLDDESVARMHAVIEIAGSDARVIDLGGTAGTIHNGRRVEKHVSLASGDVLEIGPYRVEIELHAAVAAMAVGSPQTAVAPAPAVPVASRPALQIDASEIEIGDGSSVAEVVTTYGGTVVDAQHIGQSFHGKSTARTHAPALMLAGAMIFLGGAAMFAHDVTQDWAGHQAATADAAARGLQAPDPVGTGLGGLGIGLALCGLVPFAFGAIRRNERPRSTYSIGEAPGAAFPATVRGHTGNFDLVTRSPDGSLSLCFTRDMTGEVAVEGRAHTLAELAAAGHARQSGDVHSLPIPAGARCRVQHGDVSFLVRSVAPARVIASKGEADKPFWIYNGGALAGIGSLLVLMHLVPEDMLGMSLEESDSGNRFVGYLHQPDEAPVPEEVPTPSASDDAAGSQSGARAAGPEGAMGNPDASKTAGLYKMKGPKHAMPQMARVFDPDMDARDAGILGLMQTEAGHFLASPHGGHFAVGNDDEDIWGGLRGTEYGESYGVGGLGLVGTGRQGGGTAEGTIGMGNIGTIGRIGGGGTGTQYGRGSSDGFKDRGAKVPRVRAASAVVQGAIDKDIIRRVVRVHINEVSHCYNQGLVRDPNLSGRVAVQFTINATGGVGISVVESSTVKDAAVGQCIAKAVKRWKFPKPDGGGNVIVTYPFVLASGTT